MSFKISPVSKEPVYSIDKLPRKKGITKAAALIALSVTAIITGGAEPPPPMPGKVAYNPLIYDKAELVVYLDEMYKWDCNIEMKYDIKVEIKTKDGNISFIADGYKEKYKIAYEWVALPGYTTNGKPDSILSSNEIALIKDYQFDSTYIFIIDKNRLTDIKSAFYGFYTVISKKVKFPK
ncbi:MAG: hypothetical protein HPY53_05480 [Brevinematales bacterium]|nr:hypothetical protein [Brevinematales bacterium]